MPALRANRAGQRSSSTEYMFPAIDTKRVEADIATVKTCKSTFVCFGRQRCLACAIRMAPVACPGSWNWEDHVHSISLCTSVLDTAVCSRRQLSFVIGPSGRDPVDQPRRGDRSLLPPILCPRLACPHRVVLHRDCRFRRSGAPQPPDRKILVNMETRTD
jgi:hypothetical protein